MGYKFKCPNCGDKVVVKYCLIGETILCRNCGERVVIPGDAIETDEKPQFLTTTLIGTKVPVEKERIEEIQEVEIVPSVLGPKSFFGILAGLGKFYFRHFFMLMAVTVFVEFWWFIPFIVAMRIIRGMPYGIPGERIAAAIYYAYGGLGTRILVNISYPFLYCFFAHVLAQYLANNAIRIGPAFAVSFRRLGNGVIAYILTSAAMIILMPTLLGIPLAVYLYIGWSLVFAIIGCETGMPIRALRRSAYLVKGYWGRTFGIIAVLISFIAGFNAICFRFPIPRLIGITVTAPLVALGLALIYLDLRVRKEGLTPEKLSEELSIPEAW